jgi:hypothetical protein
LDARQPPEARRRLLGQEPDLDPSCRSERRPAEPDPAGPVQPLGDVGYAAGDSAVTNANTHAAAERDYQYHNIGQQTGYDSSGNLITSGGDLNPYAQAALLKRNYDASVRGTTNNYAAQGQLYSGAIKNAQAPTTSTTARAPTSCSARQRVNTTART